VAEQLAARVDAETFLCDHLGVGVPVATRTPDPLPDAWVRIVRTGGTRRSPVSDQPTIAVEAFAQTETAAWNLIQTCCAALEAMAGSVVANVNVKNVDEVGGPANLPHPTIPGARYSATFQLHLRGVIQP
jgi:hypothetical protein